MCRVVRWTFGLREGEREIGYKGQTLNLNSFWIFLPTPDDNEKGDLVAINDNKA